ncbi:hypothetical protein IKE82_02110 [Candidatus Saccharibacteria bacterium]|nr:hypothetical protein [Candidatus Saccharibacteria bacterium]
MIDIHSHVLPGVDDGAETLADSVEILRELAAQGVTDVIATPHYVDETIYMSPRRENARLLDELRHELSREKVDVRLYLGNEIFIFGKISDLTKINRIASLNDSEYLLVELPMSGEYPNHEDVFRDLIREGYKIVLAHPERYTAAQEDFAMLERLFEMGVLLQCNTGSFIRQYGKHAEKTAVRLAKAGMIFALGSDVHHVRGREDITLTLKKLRKYYNSDELEQVLVGNPRKIVGVTSG